MIQTLLDRLHSHISNRRLLNHPFYQDWKAGALTLEDLRLYAGQYYHFETRFPRLLSAIHSRCQEPDVRQNILSNLWDEEHGNENHQNLWLDFCAGLGLTRLETEITQAHPKTQQLLDTYSEICYTRTFQEGLAAIYAYEVQVPDVASEKLAGLRDMYGIVDEKSVAFFNVHAHLDVEHSRLEAAAITEHTAPGHEAEVEFALCAALDAWWGFLDGANELRAETTATA